MTIPKPIRSIKIVMNMITSGVVKNLSLFAFVPMSFDGC